MSGRNCNLDHADEDTSSEKADFPTNLEIFLGKFLDKSVILQLTLSIALASNLAGECGADCRLPFQSPGLLGWINYV